MRIKLELDCSKTLDLYMECVIQFREQQPLSEAARMVKWESLVVGFEQKAAKKANVLQLS